MNTQMNKAEAAPAQVAQHTPGPWKVMEPYTNRAVYPIGRCIGNGAFAILAEVNSQGGTSFEAQSNARLIAAAPELLKSLEDTSGLLCRIVAMGRTPTLEECSQVNERLEEARATIAKAEGKL